MQTFFEYLATQPSRFEDLDSKEVELLLKVRNRLEKSDFGEGLVDHTGSLDNPHLWVPLPKDIGGGIRVYMVFGSLAARLQAAPNTPPVGKAFKIEGNKEKKDDKDGGDEECQDPDFSVITNLLGEIHRIINTLREDQKKRQAAISARPGQAVQFKGFWPDNPSSIPVY